MQVPRRSEPRHARPGSARRSTTPPVPPDVIRRPSTPMCAINVAADTSVGPVADAVRAAGRQRLPRRVRRPALCGHRHRLPPRVGGTAAGRVNGGLLAPLRVLDLGGAESDGVGRLFADLGADVLKVEPPGGSSARRRIALHRRRQHRVHREQRQQAQCGARPGQRRRPRAADRIGKRRRHRRGRWEPRRCGGIRNVVCGARRTVRSSGGVVGHRLRLRGSVRVEAGHRRRAVCDVDRAVADRADGGQARAAARGRGVRDGGGAGRVGGAGRLLPPIARRQRRLHRLLPLRGGAAVARSAVRFRGTGGRRPQAQQRAVAGQAAQPEHLSDLQLQGRQRPHLSAVGAPMARDARLARRTRAVRRPQVRHHRRAVRGVP